MSPSDKRQSQRKKSDYVVEIYDAEGGLLRGVGRLLDLSASGALIESTLRLLENERVFIGIRRKDRTRLDLPGSVARFRGKGVLITYGIRFERKSR